jgi:hypothetical protein
MEVATGVATGVGPEKVVVVFSATGRYNYGNPGGGLREGKSMRKGAGLLFAMALLIPVGVMAANPVGAAAPKGPTCKTFLANVVTTPGLPKIGLSTKVNATVKTTGKIGGCTTMGVTGATISGSYKYNGNCTTLLSGKGGKVTPGPSSLAWSNHTTSTTLTTLTLVSKPTANPLVLKLVTKITKGEFVGATSTGTVKATSPKGSCTTAPGAKTTLTGSGTFVFK